jgi:hypothetical protein
MNYDSKFKFMTVTDIKKAFNYTLGVIENIWDIIHDYSLLYVNSINKLKI